MKAALPAEAIGKPLEIWFQDEARVGQKGTLTRIWARKGSRPRKPQDTRYEWAYIFGAVCPARATGAAIVMPYADTEAMNAHLAAIAARDPRRAPMASSSSMEPDGMAAKRSSSRAISP